MRTEFLVERLSQNLRPVRPRSLVRDAMLLLALGAIEIAVYLGLGFMRPDMQTAMDAPSFWWKLTSLGLIAALGAGVALLSVDPSRSPRPGLRFMLVCIAAIFVSGWAIDASGDGFAHLLSRLDWRQGLQCVWQMVALSVPPALALGLLGRRGAPTDRTGTALAAGLSAAAWGAFVFVFACPSDDPLYIAVWYTVGCAIVTIMARTVMLRLWRW
jgi:hypothetical protein